MDLAALQALLIAHRYTLLLPLAVVEGPMLAFVCGILISLGYLNPLITLGILIAGDILPDTIFYFLGRYSKTSALAKRIATRFGVTDEHFQSAERLWREHPGKTMLMSKFAYGIASAFLFMAGVMRMPARIFYGWSVSISIAHYAIVLALGYFFGATLLSLGDIVLMIEYGVAGIAFAVAIYLVVIWYIRKRFGWNT